MRVGSDTSNCFGNLVVDVLTCTTTTHCVPILFNLIQWVVAHFAPAPRREIRRPLPRGSVRRHQQRLRLLRVRDRAQLVVLFWGSDSAVFERTTAFGYVDSGQWTVHMLRRRCIRPMLLFDARLFLTNAALSDQLLFFLTNAFLLTNSVPLGNVSTVLGQPDFQSIGPSHDFGRKSQATRHVQQHEPQFGAVQRCVHRVFTSIDQQHRPTSSTQRLIELFVLFYF